MPAKPDEDRVHRFLKQAIELATENVVSAHGGPFGAILAKGDEIIATGVNAVTAANDPTAHAEIVAIRAACRKANSFSLQACELYASCEPCPMCLAAAYWARIDAIWYASTREDAERAGFADSEIYREIALPAERRTLPFRRYTIDQEREPFEKWMRSENRAQY